MDAHALEQIVVGAAVVVFVIYRQMLARRVGGRAAVLPLILLGYGIYSAYIATNATGLLDHRHVAMSAVLLVVGLLIDATLGWWRATTMRAWRDEQGVLWRKGTRITVLAWMASIAARFALVAGAGYALHIQEPTAVLLIGAGVTLIAQKLVVARRAEHDGRQATVVT